MITTLDGTQIKVQEITQENYNLAISKESIAMRKALGSTNSFIKAGLHCIDSDIITSIVWIAKSSLAPKYMREAIKEYEENK